CGRIRRDRQWQLDDELASYGLPRRRAVGFDAPAVQVHDPVHERQPDAQPPGRAIERTIRLREKIKDARQQLTFNAHAIVTNSDLRIVGAARALAVDLDLAAIWGVLRRIVEQVNEDLLDAGGVGIRPDRIET